MLRAQEFVLRTIARRSGPSPGQAVWADSPQELDCDEVLAFAEHHSIIPLLYARCGYGPTDHSPDGFLGRLQSRFRAGVGGSIALATELARVVRALESDGLPVIAFKGPALAVQIFGSPCLRDAVDLDILVRRSDVQSSLIVLAGLGYFPAQPANVAPQLFRSRHEVRLASRATGTAVDLHWKLTEEMLGECAGFDSLVSRSETVSVCGFEIRTLGISDLLLYTAAHAGQHCWTRLKWIADAAEILRCRRDLVWGDVLASASKANCLNVLLVTLTLARDIFGAELPKGVEARISANRRVIRVAGEISLMLSETSVPRRLEELWLRSSARERWVDRARLVIIFLRDIFRPTDADRIIQGSSLWLAPLVYVTRPLRLAYVWLNRHPRTVERFE
jgi:Uncharacterised nucleotidyltransferase